LLDTNPVNNSCYFTIFGFSLVYDGRLFEELHNQQIVDFFRIELQKSPNDPAAVAARMLTRALESGSKDNMSCVIVQFCDGSDYNQPNEFVAGTYYDRYRTNVSVDMPWSVFLCIF
jgi:hypothetical protein